MIRDSRKNSRSWKNSSLVVSSEKRRVFKIKSPVKQYQQNYIVFLFLNKHMYKSFVIFVIKYLYE